MGKRYNLWGTPGEGSPPKNSPPDCFSPLLRFLRKKNSQSADCEAGLCPSTPPPFEKGGRKLLIFCYLKNDYMQITADSSFYCPPFFQFVEYQTLLAIFSGIAANLSLNKALLSELPFMATSQRDLTVTSFAPYSLSVLTVMTFSSPGIRSK